MDVGGLELRIFRRGGPSGPAPADVGRRPRAVRGYGVLGGVAIIPTEGTLVAKLGTLCPYSGLTAYDGIRLNFLTALAFSAAYASHRPQSAGAFGAHERRSDLD